MYELLASEYKWSLDQIKALTRAQIQLFLDRLLARKMREAGGANNVEEGSADNGVEVLKTQNDFRNFFGQ